jgi:molecular chaperone GrpE (heat shock protein)
MPLALLLARSIFNLSRMSDDRQPARLAKWPFYLADLLLSAVIFFVLYQLGTFEGTTELLIVIACLVTAALAAWFSILPWIKEHSAALQISDSANLRSSLEQIRSVEKIADLIRQSNIQWQGVQDASGKTLTAAREISEKMKVEADEFMKFISHAHDQERTGLRLEVEKMRRMEADWIKVAVQMLDHVFALTRAAERSGQVQIIKQLQQFQNACRDVARRMGLAPFVPALGDTFDQRTHQLPNPQMVAPEGATIQEVLACGFTYQGQLLRRSLVLLESSVEEGTAQQTALPPESSEPAQEGQAPVGSESEAPSAAETETGENLMRQEEIIVAQEQGTTPVFREESPVPVFKEETQEKATEEEITEKESEALVESNAGVSEIVDSEMPNVESKPERPRGVRASKRPGQDELPF